MADMLREHPTLVGGIDDTAYVAQIWANEMSDGRWEAWVLFVPISTGRARRTERETIQAHRAGVEYWASGVTSIYLQGAFARSRPARVTAAAGRAVRPPVPFPRRLPIRVRENRG